MEKSSILLFSEGSGFKKRKHSKKQRRPFELKIFFFIIVVCVVGGFNPLEKYWSKWESSPNRGENKKYVKPPASCSFVYVKIIQKEVISWNNSAKRWPFLGMVRWVKTWPEEINGLLLVTTGHGGGGLNHLTGLFCLKQISPNKKSTLR